jgi:hypothetical protein
MASGSGTSVLGYQNILVEGTRELPYFALSIDGDTGNAPLNVGYFYVNLYINSEDPQLLYARGIVYRQGNVVILPDATATGFSFISAWVNWKQSGLNFATFW